MHRWLALPLVVACAGSGEHTPGAATASPPGGPPTLTACPEGAPTQGCFRKIEGGLFRMGAQATDPAAVGYDAEAAPEEAPPRSEQVKPFWLQGTEATVGQYAACAAAGACPARTATPDEAAGAAVANITWAEAGALCRFLGGRLPTSAEWEHVARAGADQRFPWGWAPDCPGARSGTQPSAAAPRKDAFVQGCPAAARLLPKLDKLGQKMTGDALSLFSEAEGSALCAALQSAPDDKLVEVATTRARAALNRAGAAPLPSCPPYAVAPAGTHNDEHLWGLQDLSGNVAEWTADDAGSGRRVVRGGSFVLHEAADARASAMTWVPQDQRQADIGVRCARDAAPPADPARGTTP